MDGGSDPVFLFSGLKIATVPIWGLRYMEHERERTMDLATLFKDTALKKVSGLDDDAWADLLGAMDSALMANGLVLVRQSKLDSIRAATDALKQAQRD